MSHIVQCTGLPWDTVLEEFDLPRTRAMNKYWRSHPPLHLMVAEYLGIKPEREKAQDFSELISSIPLEENPSWIPSPSKSA